MVQSKLEDTNNLELILEALIVKNDESLNEKLLKTNQEYCYKRNHEQDLENMISELIGSEELLIEYVDTVAEINTFYSEAMYLRGLKDGINLLQYASNDKTVNLFGKEY